MKTELKKSGNCINSSCYCKWIYCKSQPSLEVSPLFLENVEALARGESEGGYCFGIGTVDCPFNHTKVDTYYAPYSLLY